MFFNEKSVAVSPILYPETTTFSAVSTTSSCGCGSASSFGSCLQKVSVSPKTTGNKYSFTFFILKIFLSDYKLPDFDLEEQELFPEQHPAFFSVDCSVWFFESEESDLDFFDFFFFFCSWSRYKKDWSDEEVISDTIYVLPSAIASTVCDNT